MPEIIRNGEIVQDDWEILRDDDAPLPEGKVIVSVERWQDQAPELRERDGVGVWLKSDQSPKLIADDLPHLDVVAVDFPKFADGRGFSYGRELREQHGFEGELRAIGDFMRDQLFYLKRCGFDSFQLQGTDLPSALDSLHVFSEPYQAAQDQPLPLFRRR